MSLGGSYRRIAVVFALLLVAAVGCRQQDSATKINVALSVEPSPPAVGQAKLTLTLEDESGSPVEGATLKLEGNMAHAGMKPVFADANEDKAGRYRADMEFTMGGDWFILVEGKLADGRAVHQKIDVKGVKAE
jgi:hypothetical protein